MAKRNDGKKTVCQALAEIISFLCTETGLPAGHAELMLHMRGLHVAWQ